MYSAVVWSGGGVPISTRLRRRQRLHDTSTRIGSDGRPGRAARQPADSRRDALEPFALHQPFDPPANLVADLAYALGRLSLRVRQVPVLPAQARHERARVATPHGDEELGAGGQLGREEPRGDVADLDARLAPCGHDLGVNGPGRG